MNFPTKNKYTHGKGGQNSKKFLNMRNSAELIMSSDKERVN
ncbi:MAG: hypothetical protein Kow0098_08570 [Ignavibacteriaceae bacterium]